MLSKDDAIARLRRQLNELANVPPSRHDRSGTFDRWHRATRVAIEKIFGDESKHAKEFAGVDYYPFIVTQNTTEQDRQEAYARGLDRAKLLLESFAEEIEDYWPSSSPVSVPLATEPEYDVCLSFAGENRPYVEAVATALRDAGVRPFYDLYEEVQLWGKDLYQHLDEIYRRRARFCVLFVSDAYAKKLWTKHELRSAQARAFQEHAEYILPARFDDTELPGVAPTIGYVDLTRKTPLEFAKLIIQKVRSALSGATAVSQTSTAGRSALLNVRSTLPENTPRPNIQPIRPWFTTVRTGARGVLREDSTGALKALIAPFRNDPTPQCPRVSAAKRVSTTVLLEAIPDFRVTGHWLNSRSPHLSFGVGEQWLLVVAVVATKLASLVADGRRGRAGAVEYKHFWNAPTNVTEVIAVVSVGADGILVGEYRYSLSITPPFPNITLL